MNNTSSNAYILYSTIVIDGTQVSFYLSTVKTVFLVIFRHFFVVGNLKIKIQVFLILAN